MYLVHIGFDDIDSPFGGCTTDLVSQLVVDWVRRDGIRFIDYPNLIRLCPAVPWKTRGNGSVVLRLHVREIDIGVELFEEAVARAYDYVVHFRHPESHPAVVLYVGRVTDRLRWLGRKAVQDIVPIDLVDRLISKLGDRVRVERLCGRRGVIGALAGIGYTMEDTDYTYELIAYRREDYWGSPRKIDPVSVREMDKMLRGETFLNYDYEIDRPLIAPHGPDPVLFGIRGESPEALVKALEIIRVEEPITRWVLYRTNQATDAHLKRINSLGEAYIYTGIIFRGRVSKPPRRIRGGHVIFGITDGAQEIDVAAYEPTGGFRNIVGKLWIGDLVEIYGVVRPQSSYHGPTVNLEKLRVIEVASRIVYEAPKCPRCGKRMKSMGRGKGYRCPRCGFRDPKAKKIAREIPRDLRPGFYQPPPRAFKHLMKPIERFGREKKRFLGVLYGRWYGVSS